MASPFLDPETAAKLQSMISSSPYQASNPGAVEAQNQANASQGLPPVGPDMNVDQEALAAARQMPESVAQGPIMQAPEQATAPASTPVTRIPGGWTPTSRSMAGPNVDPELLSQYQQGQDQLANIQKQSYFTEQAKQMELRGAEVARAEAEAKATQERLDKMNKRQSYIDAKMQDAQKVMDDTANAKIDESFPGPTAAKISTIIGSGLIAFATRGRNSSLDQLNAVIDRHIQTQKDNLSAKRQGAQNTMNQLKEFMQMGMDRDEAEKAAQAAAWDAVYKKAQYQIEQKYSGQSIPEQAQMTLAGIQQSADRAKLEAQAAFGGQFDKKEVYRPDQYVGGAGAAGAGGKFDRKYVGGVGYVDSSGYLEVAKKKEALNALRSSTQEYANLAKQYNIMERAKDKVGASEIGQQMELLAGQMMGQASQAAGSGTPQEGEAQRFIGAMKPRLLGSNPLAGPQALEKWVNGQEKSLTNAYAPAQGAPEVGVNPQTGKAYERAQVTGKIKKEAPKLRPVK